MDTTTITQGNFENGWSIYLISFLVLIALFFIQKYSYLIDQKLGKLYNPDFHWYGKPWPLLSGLLLGFIVFLFSVFLPGELSFFSLNWGWPETSIAIIGIIIILGTAIESIKNFGIHYGILRIIITLILATGYFYAGLLAGLLFAGILAFVIIIYFILFWKKRLTIK